MPRYLYVVEKGMKTWTLVAGPFASKQEAEDTAMRLRAAPGRKPTELYRVRKI